MCARARGCSRCAHTHRLLFRYFLVICASFVCGFGWRVFLSICVWWMKLCWGVQLLAQRGTLGAVGAAPAVSLELALEHRFGAETAEPTETGGLTGLADRAVLAAEIGGCA